MSEAIVNRTHPQPNTLWRHYKGRLYIVLAVGRMEGDETAPEMAIYRSAKDGTVWIRPLAEFLGEAPMLKISRFVSILQIEPEERPKRSAEACGKFTGPSGWCSTCLWPAVGHAGAPRPKDRKCATFVAGTGDECAFCCLPFKWHAPETK